MSGFVLDCSVAMAWCFEDEASPEADALLDRLRLEGAIVPALWFWEVSNVLTFAVRKGRLSQNDAQARMRLLDILPIATDPEGPARAWRETAMLAQAHRLSAYDAAYLELAMRLGIALATRDQDLSKAGAAVGIELLS